MELFQIIAGACSILSLFLTIFAVSKIIRIENKVIDKSDHSVHQTLKAGIIKSSKVNQGIGKDGN